MWRVAVVVIVGAKPPEIVAIIAIIGVGGPNLKPHIIRRWASGASMGN